MFELGKGLAYPSRELFKGGVGNEGESPKDEVQSGSDLASLNREVTTGENDGIRTRHQRLQ